MEALGVGLVGYGGIGKLHASVYRSLPVAYGQSLPAVRLVGVCTLSQGSADRARAETGVELATTDLAALLGHPDLDVVDCCVPTAAHAAVAAAAFAADKALYCEKPLAHTLAAAEDIAAAARHPFGVHFHFRWAPALRHARRLIDDGFLGDLYSARLVYLRSSNVDPRRPISWRFRRAEGGGVLLDLGSHIVDLACYLFGPIAAVSARLSTIIPQRTGADGSLEQVDVDDMAWLDVEFSRGGVATLEASKMAVGAQDDLRFEAYGSRGALRFDAMDPHWLWTCEAQSQGQGQGAGAYPAAYVRRPVGDRHDPPPAVPGAEVVGGLPAWHMAAIAAFLRSLAADTPFSPGLIEALAVQRVLDAAARSARDGGRRLPLVQPTGSTG
jgi:predicted dehydrogenase